MPHLSIRSITKHKTAQRRSVAFKSLHCANGDFDSKYKPKKKTKKQFNNYSDEFTGVELLSVFGIKWHRTQFYFDVGHVSVCVSACSAPLAFAVRSRSGSLLFTLLILCL